MAKKQFILNVNDRTPLARNKRLREAGASVYISGSTSISNSGGNSGIDEKGVVDVSVSGSGNAVTDAKLSSDGTTIVLNKGRTFLDQSTAEDLFLYRDKDDETPFKLTIGEVEVTGNLTVDNYTILRNMLDAYGKSTFHDTIQTGSEFVTGLLGKGGQITDGYGEMRGLTLWEWLEVPELRYNRVSINTGITWQTFGGGIIEKVEQTGDNTGIITLKLEDGEVGAIAENDLCMGIYHNFDGGNDEENTDEHNGNFHFCGFKTIYFRVESILDTSDNSKFTYVLRPSDGTGGNWTEHNHPCEYMHFAAYANPNNTDRQECIYSTTTYLIALYHMTDWEYGQNNIYYIRGILEGFNVGGTELQGTGIYIGNGYFSGILQEISNMPYELNIEIVDGDYIMEEGDERTLQCTVTKGYITDITITAWSVTRETGDSEADAAWNAAHTDFDGTLHVDFDSLFEDANSALLRFSATVDTGDVVTNSIVMRAMYIEDPDYRMDIDTLGDIFISPTDKEPLKVTCYVFKGWEDKTSEVKYWGVSRDSGDESEDKAWNNDHTDFAGYIELTYSDLGADVTRETTLFTFTANDGHVTTNAQIIVG